MRLAGQDAAHLVVHAAEWIRGSGTVSKAAQGVAGLGGLSEALFDLSQVPVNQVSDVLAGSLAAVWAG
jgi:hypothetical protein